MYIRNYLLRNTWLNKCLKTPVSQQRSTGLMLKGPNTAEILTTALLSCLFITLTKMKLQKVSVSDIWRLFVNTLTTDDKYSFGTSESF